MPKQKEKKITQKVEQKVEEPKKITLEKTPEKKRTETQLVSF